MSAPLIMCLVRSETLILSVQTRSYGCIPYKENSSLQGEVHTEESGTGGWRVCGALIRRPCIALMFYHDDEFPFSYMDLLCWRLYKPVSFELLIAFYFNMCIFGSGYGYGVFAPCFFLIIFGST